MTRFRRWCAVALGTLLLVGTPVALRVLPAAESDLSAARLLELVRGSTGAGWTGYVETEGTLQLPDADRFSEVGALFGERTRMRVWWRDADHWRVDQLLVAGENDLVHTGPHTLEWDYERAEATISRDPEIRLPRTADLIPPELGLRLLRGVVDDDVSPIPARRVAGTSAPGLRAEPSSPRSSIDHVDLWAHPQTGVPLRVEVYTGGDGGPSFTSTFREFSVARPGVGEVAFTATAGTEVRFEDVLDIADAANQYAPVVPPEVVADLPRTSGYHGAVGVYGRGMTQVIAIPLRDREADALRTQLGVTPGVVHGPERTQVAVGPLGVLVTGEEGDGGWLLAGTLTPEALVMAADDVVTGFVRTEDDDR